MATIPFLVPVLMMGGGVLLGMWLKKHPGHPILQKIDDMLLEETQNAQMQQAAKALAKAGVQLPK